MFRLRKSHLICRVIPKKLSCPKETKMPILLNKTIIRVNPNRFFFIIYFENKENSRNGKSQTMLKHCINGPNFVETLFDFLNVVLFYRFSVSTFCISFEINTLLDLRKRKIEWTVVAWPMSLGWSASEKMKDINLLGIFMGAGLSGNNIAKSKKWERSQWKERSGKRKKMLRSLICSTWPGEKLW